RSDDGWLNVFFEKFLVIPKILLVVEDLFFDIISFEKSQDRILDIGTNKSVAWVINGGFDDTTSKHPAFEQLFPAHSDTMILAIIRFIFCQERTQIRIVYPEYRQYGTEGSVGIVYGFFGSDTQYANIHPRRFFVEYPLFLDLITFNDVRVEFFRDGGVFGQP